MLTRFLLTVSMLALLATAGGILIGSATTSAQEQTQPSPPQTPPHQCHRKPPVTS